MENTGSFYSLLNVRKNSSAHEIRSAYKKQALKWHPDKWLADPSLSEKAKLRFQQIREAYSVLSDDMKRALYDAGMYESSEDTDAFCDFLDEISTLMNNVKVQRNEEDEAEELQAMFKKMVQDDWFSLDSFDSPKVKDLKRITNKRSCRKA
ncbi:hypothetical protein SUGI_0297960 [Cryptomeria japonica]|uniref:uncharacterized protein LOC131034195 n=1 Tax=Cryptomeria japonica TaxID=3369 RepID=UPI002408AB03|nr:uncharacterized protein LOC131034195 [Cryptomeria japonica]GLJ17205.1 hypothetical protein SUGI_0297960 [Cryptomeria japonica]